jgi:hypothetical protein
MSSAYREVGIGMVDAPAGKATGPLLVTQDFGGRSNQGNPFVLGVAYADANRNGFYDVGEGLGGATVTLRSGTRTFTTTTSAAGGYQLQVPNGTYTLTVSGAGLTNPPQTVTVNGANVHINFVRAAPPPAPTVTGPGSTTSSTTPTLTWTASQGAVRYELWVNDLTTGASQVIHLTNLTATSFRAATALARGHRYAAWVRAFDGLGQASDWSQPLVFAVL